MIANATKKKQEPGARGGLIRERVARRKTYREHFLTAVGPEGAPAAESARRVYEELAAILAQKGIRPWRETLYGDLKCREAALSQRRKALKARGLEDTPAAFIEGRPVWGEGLAGVQVWGFSGQTEVATVETPDARGRLWSAPRARLLHLCSVTGDAGSSAPPEAQAEAMLQAARRALESQGFRYPQVARTWLYLARILDWYAGFNRTRSALYARPDFLDEGPEAFPASTGIQGRAGRGECVMDLLAVSGESVRVRPVLKSSRQGPSSSYGSAFSRAGVLEIAGARTILVSGTASIDAAGQSVRLGDPEGQALETLLNIAALLEEQGSGLQDVCSATLFCKDRAAYDAYRRVSRLLGTPELPCVPVLADVCRPELLVEIEAVAVPL